MMKEFVDGIKKYVEFDGRTARRDFWMFTLWSFLLSIGVGIVGWMLNLEMLGNLFSLFVFLPSLAIGVRRLHDIGRSGWWMLLLFIPLIGFIWLIVLMCLRGVSGENAYGADPLSAPAPTPAPTPAPAPSDSAPQS